MSESKAHRQQVRDALSNEVLQTALARAATAWKNARTAAMEDFDFVEGQAQARSIKEHAVANIDALFAKFKKEAEAVGAVVYQAADGDEAAEIVKRLAEERGVKLIAKSKSMLTEEIELNPRLKEAGLEVVETDLGEWIVQLAGEKPSHFTAPSLHKTREETAALFSKVVGEDVDPDIPNLVKIARKQLRQVFIDADMGISGANVAIAETGTLVIVSNEGNVRLVTTLPPIHVAIVGYEKLVPTMDDATAILKVLARSGTGQKQTAYTSFITGPSRTTDIEKTLAIGVHGPGELHIIFVDNGRKAMAADPDLREGLYCLKCGACLNNCPVYNSVGGYAFGNTYMGGIGTVVTAHHDSLDAVEDTAGLCTGCGECSAVCPSRIETPRMILELRKRLVDKNGMPLAGKLPLTAVKHPGIFRSALRMARAFQAPAISSDGSVRQMPVISDILGGRKMPGLAPRFLHELLPERGERTGKISVALYAGCMLDFIYPEIGQAIWKVLGDSDVTAIYPHGQSCCGAPALYVGDQVSARKMAIDNLEALSQAETDYIVTGCPTCAVMLKEQLPRLVAGTQYEDRARELSGKVIDFAAFATDVLDHRPDASRAALRRVTYHDPCHQVRGLGTSGSSRDLIRRAGCDLVEMANCDDCCGFAGSYSIKQPGVSTAILDRKLANIEETRAQIVATDCPGCIMHIRGGLKGRGSSVEVCHTAQIIAGLLER